ncbi:MAG: TetR family transcriptional regulator [Chloroflexi bacterium]|nr:MAG: TetR family transcriptional regulator [Chloroflexota bacterium]
MTNIMLDLLPIFLIINNDRSLFIIRKRDMPRSSKEKSAETRAEIIESAYRLFIERGYSATSLRDISQQAGVPVGAIYTHFPNKEEIWKEVILAKHPYHEIFPLLGSAEGDTIDEVVRSAARALVRELLKRRDLLNLMFIEIVEFNARHIPDLFHNILPEVAALREIFQGKRGRLRNIPMPVLARSFAGLFFSYYITGIMMAKVDQDPINDETLSQFVDLYLYGILADDDPSRLRRPHPAEAA